MGKKTNNFILTISLWTIMWLIYYAFRNLFKLHLSFGYLLFFIIGNITVIISAFKQKSNIGGKYKTIIIWNIISILIGIFSSFSVVIFPREAYSLIIFFGLSVIIAIIILSMYFTMPKEQRQIRLLFKILLIIIIVLGVLGWLVALIALMQG
ncbi:hypothetical protein J7L48_03885 [bacterium]|nr:hypothetical protein [bacterium]